jgi:SAM-dependent methyltransferase
MSTSPGEGSPAASDQAAIDARNAGFWDELCGSALARSLGIVEITPESLARFDATYMGYYPYLSGYVDREPLVGKRVLEIGLGFGTLGQLLAERGADYHGLDIAEGPVAMMQQRLTWLGIGDVARRVTQGSALDIPHETGSFDYVYTIGCLHHTGDIPGSVNEVHRILRPGGKAIVMLYNARSLRHLALPLAARVSRRWRANRDEELRRTYDANEAGDAAPHTDFVSPGEARAIFSSFSQVQVDIQNLQDVGFGRFRIPRRRLLRNAARIVGLDLYITAEK